MSHFSVLVVGSDPEKQLAPYHDEYVVDVDKTEEALAVFATRDDKTQGILEFVEDYYGGLPVVGFPASEETRAALRTGEGKWGWVEADTSKGWVEADTSNPDVNLIRVVDRTNPNRHWDWYQIGGRWTGYFPLKPGAAGETGSPGLMTRAPKAGWVDQCRWGDVDLEAARSTAAAEATKRFTAWEGCLLAGPDPKPWEFFHSKVEAKEIDIDAARAAYHAQPAVKAVWDSKDIRGYDAESFIGKTVTEYVVKARNKACVPFAVVKDGQWFERGRMGWWGMVAGDSSDEEWSARVASLLDGLDPETLVTIVDCHI